MSNFELKMFGKVFYRYHRDNNGLVETVLEEEKVIMKILKGKEEQHISCAISDERKWAYCITNTELLRRGYE